MLYWLFYEKLYHVFTPFRVFQYSTFRTAFASLTALFLCIVLGPWLIAKLRASRAYLKAYQDFDFMSRKDLRSVRLQLELLKPETLLREHKIRSTIVVFGSARVLSPEDARRRLASAQEALAGHPRDAEFKRRVVEAEKKVELSRWYDEARRFAAINDTAIVFADPAAMDCMSHGDGDRPVLGDGGCGVAEAEP